MFTLDSFLKGQTCQYQPEISVSMLVQFTLYLMLFLFTCFLYMYVGYQLVVKVFFSCVLLLQCSKYLNIVVSLQESVVRQSNNEFIYKLIHHSFIYEHCENLLNNNVEEHLICLQSISKWCYLQNTVSMKSASCLCDCCFSFALLQ